MSKATDYRICTSFFEAYIAKVSKLTPDMMTSDRRAITQDELLTLIDWFLNKELGHTHHSLSFNSHFRDDYRVKLTYIRKKQDDECK